MKSYTKCNLCDREGLLIYLVRYAVACPKGAAGVPKLSGNFKIVGAPQEIATAQYALRAMRGGYAYIYDEKRKTVTAYMVTPSGLLWKFPLMCKPYRPITTPDPTNIQQLACTGEVKAALAHCIDVKHSEKFPAQNIWIGWSNVQWTAPSLMNMEHVGWRKKHMQCINIPAMLEGKATHAGELNASRNNVAHFVANKDQMNEAFSFSNTPPTHEIDFHLGADLLSQTMAQTPMHKGFIVALNDPVGITNDLSELTVPSAAAGFDEDMARGKMVYDLLQATEVKVRAGARESLARDEIIGAAFASNPECNVDVYNANKTVWKMIKAGGPGKYKEKQEAERKKYGDAQAGRVQAEEDRAWEDVISQEEEQTSKTGVKTAGRKALLDETRREAFPEAYIQAVKQFAPKYEKLAQAHLAWLMSTQLANWLAGVHDGTDLRSGYAYSESVLQCIGKAVATKHCSAQLLKWMNHGIPKDTSNLYGRALMFNHDEIINAKVAHVKGSDIQYENYLNIYKQTLNKIEENQALKLVDRLALGTANIFMKALKNGAKTVMGQMALMHLTFLGGPILKVSDQTPQEIGKWVLATLKEKGIELNTGKRTSQSSAFREARKAVSGDRTSMVALEFNTAQLEAEHIITASSLKVVKIPGLDMTEKWLGSSAPREFHLGVVTAIVQLVALSFATQDVINNNNENLWETRAKVTAAALLLAGTLVDTVAQTVAVAPTHPLGVFLKSQWAYNKESALMVAKYGRFIAMAGGMIAGAYDIFGNAPPAWKKGNKLLAGLYVTDGVLAIEVAYLGLTGAILFWPLLILSIIFGMTIALINSGALQQWAMRCYFSMGVSLVRARSHGKPPYQPYPYPTLNEELKAYNDAMGA